MSHPFQAIALWKRPWIFLGLLTFTAVVMTVLNITDAPLKTSAAPSGIVSYEMAGTQTQANAILASWDSFAKQSAAFQLGFDYLFMPAYSTTIALACVMGAWVFTKRGGGFFVILGLILAWGQWLAVIFDAIENMGLAVMLFNQASGLWPQLSFTMAVMKFTLILIGIAYSAAAGIVSLISKPRVVNQRAGY